MGKGDDRQEAGKTGKREYRRRRVEGGGEDKMGNQGIKRNKEIPE